MHLLGNSQNYENQNVENQKELRKPCKPSQRRKDDQNVEKRIFRTSKSKLSQRRKELITTTKITTSKRMKRTSKVSFLSDFHILTTYGVF